MAMIKCPKCGEMISDKAAKCVHCGFDLTKKSKKICKECGAELEDGATICGNCGCPVEEKVDIENTVSVSNVKESKTDIDTSSSDDTKKADDSKKGTTSAKSNQTNSTYKKRSISKKWIGIIIGVVVVLVIGLISVQMKKQAEIKAQQEAEAAAEEQYGEDIKNLNDTLLVATARAETCGNKIHDVWYNTIWKKNDTETDKFTIDSVTGSFNSDFNTSLTNLFSNQDFKKNGKSCS